MTIHREHNASRQEALALTLETMWERTLELATRTLYQSVGFGQKPSATWFRSAQPRSVV